MSAIMLNILNSDGLSADSLIQTCTTYKLNRGSFMSAHVLLNLLNELGKRDKMRGLPSILSLFRNEFNKFNNTRARMLDSIYHMTTTLKSHFWRKNVIICHYVRNVIIVVYRFYCMALFHSETRRHMII